MVFDKSWLLNLGILRPPLLHLDDAERNSAEPYKEKQNAKDLFVHGPDHLLTVMADRATAWPLRTRAAGPQQASLRDTTNDHAAGSALQ